MSASTSPKNLAAPRVPEPQVIPLKARALLRVKELHAGFIEAVQVKQYEQNEDKLRGMDDQAANAQAAIDFNKEVARVIALGIRAREIEDAEAAKRAGQVQGNAGR